MQLWREQCRQPGIFSPLLPSFTLDISLFRSLQQRERPTFFTLQNPARLRGAPSARGLRHKKIGQLVATPTVSHACASRATDVTRRHGDAGGCHGERERKTCVSITVERQCANGNAFPFGFAF